MSSTAFEVFSDEQLDDADWIRYSDLVEFSALALERYCLEYHIWHTDQTWNGIIQHIKFAVGFKAHEEAILALPITEHTAHLSNALQAYIEYVRIQDPQRARRALRLLIKHVKRGGPMPIQTFASEAFLGGGRDPAHMGGFSDVFCAQSQAGDIVALKRIRLNMNNRDKTDLVWRLCREAIVWRSLEHPYILPFMGIDCHTFPEYPCLVAPWMSYGTLWDFVKQNADNGTERLRFIHESAQGLNYLHNSGIIHGDLKAANVFISHDLHPLLADFGLSGIGDTMTVAAATTRSHDGSSRWMAPELHHPDRFGVKFKRTRATDMYAFGGLALEIITGSLPFADVPNDMSVAMKIIDGVKPAQWPLPVHRPAWDVVDRCWSLSASDRPLAADVIRVLDGLPRTQMVQSENEKRGLIKWILDEDELDPDAGHRPRYANNGVKAKFEGAVRLGVSENVWHWNFSLDGQYLFIVTSTVAEAIHIKTQSVAWAIRNSDGRFHWSDVCIGSRKFAFCRGRNFWIWDTSSGVITDVLDLGPNSYSPNEIFLALEESSIVILSYKGPLKIWDFGLGENRLRTLPLPFLGRSDTRWKCHDAVMSPCGKFVICYTSYYLVAIWDIATGQLLTQLKPYFLRFSLQDATFTANNNGLVVTIADYEELISRLEYWDIDLRTQNGSQVQTLPTRTIARLVPNMETYPSASTSISADSQWIIISASGRGRHDTLFYNVETDRLVTVLERMSDTVFVNEIKGNPNERCFGRCGSQTIMLYSYSFD